MNILKNHSLFRQQNLLNGKWIDADNHKSFSVRNPFTQEILGHVPDCGRDETKRAIESAQDAFKIWRNYTAKKRADLLLKWFELIEKNKEDLALLMTLEQGKPINESRGEIDYANSFIRWFAEEARRVYGDIIPSNKLNQRLLVLKQPIGVIASITPWNFPAAMITRKCAPALAVGCTAVIKPAEDTPYSALALGVLAQEAGFPPGVINVLTGNAEIIGKELTTNPLVRKFSFTGSTEVGKLLMQQCSSTIKKLSLELGGNAPLIIFEDANMEKAVAGTIASKFRNTGQTCVCANRIYVHEKIYDNFAERLTLEVKKLKVGNGLENSTQIGPLINDQAIKKVESHITDAIDKGATILTGGKTVGSNVLLFEPTVLTNMHSDMLIAHEETFGPVAALFPFSNDEEVIQKANDTPFGLAAYFFTESMKRMWHVAEALDYGIVGVNEGIISTEVAPFGGFKESGIGREGSKYGIEDYVEIKYVCLSD